MSSTYTYRFDCTHCGESKVQTAPPDLKFILFYDEERNELDPHQSPATCAKCSKLIDKHNEPIEAILHGNSIVNKAKKKADANNEPRPAPIKKAKIQEVKSLPPAEQTAPPPDAMALLANAIAGLVEAQTRTNEKLDQLIGKDNGKEQTIRRPLEGRGRRENVATSPGNQGRQTANESGSRLRKPAKRSDIKASSK